MVSQRKQAAADEPLLNKLLAGIFEERGRNGRISKKALKRGFMLKEIVDDVKKKLADGQDFTPADLMRIYGLLSLFVMEFEGIITLPDLSLDAWNKFKESFYQYTSPIDDMLDFKKYGGRPTNAQTTLLKLSGVFLREHYLTARSHKDDWKRNYISLLADVLALRLAKSEDWALRKTRYEREKTLFTEFKAAKTAANRFWALFYGEKPHRLTTNDRFLVLERLAKAGLSLE